MDGKSNILVSLDLLFFGSDRGLYKGGVCLESLRHHGQVHGYP